MNVHFVHGVGYNSISRQNEPEHGDILTIKTIGGSEQYTLKQCFNFANIELQHQRIVNSIRYIHLIDKNIINFQTKLIDDGILEYNKKFNLNEKYVEIRHKLLDIELSQLLK